jgi:tRNA-splicing ligase RtcB
MQSGYNALQEDIYLTELGDQIVDNAMMQLGTLGGGNHFIELQINEAGMLCFMLHSGSRNMGNKLAQFHTKTAQALNAKYFSACPPAMAFLPVDSDEGASYVHDMSVAVEFAKANRHLMVERCKSVLLNMVEKYCGITGVVISHEIESTHNYAALEHHFGENVYVHRKGAIKIKEGNDPIQAIIPGSCGTASYIVIGNSTNTTDSFNSASHGAGRTKGRKQAKATITPEEAKKSLEGIVHVNDIKRIIDECPLAYKDIEEVIRNEVELVTPLMKLRPIAFLKGEGEEE